MYTTETSLDVLVFNGTVIKYEVNKQMKVNAYLFPFDVVGNCPIESLHNLQMVLTVSLGALAVYESCLARTEYTIYKYLYVDGCLPAFKST